MDRALATFSRIGRAASCHASTFALGPRAPLKRAPPGRPSESLTHRQILPYPLVTPVVRHVGAVTPVTMWRQSVAADRSALGLCNPVLFEELAPYVNAFVRQLLSVH